MATIPASAIVQVTPSVISAGGSALDLNGLILSTAARVPIGSVQSFPTALAVASFFGAASTEAALAAIYFNGFDNSNVKPGALLFAQYNTTVVGGVLRGANLTLTLAQLQALSGTLIVTVAGTLFTSSTINLASASSFSNAATLIQAGFTSPTFTVTYDSVIGGFVFTNTATGATSTLTYATGTLSTSLALTAATGATLSQGAAVAVPGTFMAAVIAQVQNWVSFTTAFDPDSGAGNTLKQAFAAWTASQGNRYVYVAWDTDVTPTASTAATTSLGYILSLAGTAGTVPVYAPDATKAAFALGSLASIDFTQKNGLSTLAFKSQSTTLTVDVSTSAAQANLIANGYNFYGAYATAKKQFNFFYPGSITGPYAFADAYVSQVWLTLNLQQALLTLLTQVKSIPYTTQGYTLIRESCMDPINQALNFGMFGAGAPLSASQAAQVNYAAGLKIDAVLSSQGWYLQILPATAAVRAARGTPPMTLWYIYAGAVQKINLASVQVQ